MQIAEIVRLQEKCGLFPKAVMVMVATYESNPGVMGHFLILLTDGLTSRELANAIISDKSK